MAVGGDVVWGGGRGGVGGSRSGVTVINKVENRNSTVGSEAIDVSEK